MNIVMTHEGLFDEDDNPVTELPEPGTRPHFRLCMDRAECKRCDGTGYYEKDDPVVMHLTMDDALSGKPKKLYHRMVQAPCPCSIELHGIDMGYKYICKVTGELG